MGARGELINGLKNRLEGVKEDLRWLPPSRERSLVETKIDEAILWLTVTPTKTNEPVEGQPIR